MYINVQDILEKSRANGRGRLGPSCELVISMRRRVAETVVMASQELCEVMLANKSAIRAVVSVSP